MRTQIYEIAVDFDDDNEPIAARLPAENYWRQTSVASDATPGAMWLISILNDATEGLDQ